MVFAHVARGWIEKSVLMHQVYRNLLKDTTTFVTAPSMRRHVCPVGPFPLAHIRRTTQQRGVGSGRTV
jgi:hypothetical protein